MAAGSTTSTCIGARVAATSAGRRRRGGDSVLLATRTWSVGAATRTAAATVAHDSMRGSVAHLGGGC